MKLWASIALGAAVLIGGCTLRPTVNVDLDFKPVTMEPLPNPLPGLRAAIKKLGVSTPTFPRDFTITPPALVMPDNTPANIPPPVGKDWDLDDILWSCIIAAFLIAITVAAANWKK